MKKTGLCLGLACKASLCLSSVAVAQDEDPFDLGEIVLKGELQQRSLDDTQSSVEVVTGEELERRGDQELYDVIERTPGVTSTQGEQGFSVRGINQRGIQFGTGLTVSIQVDGVALPTNESSFFGPYAVWDLDQIEVFRGPQSTQQGRNALAGAIVIRTNDPIFEPEASLRLDYGSRDFYRFAFVANTPLVEDKLALRFSGVSQRENGFVFNPTLGVPYDPSSIEELRFKLRWTPNDRLDAVFSYSVTENFGGEDFIQGEVFPARINTSNILSFEGSRHQNTALRLSYELSNGHFLEYEFNYYVNDYDRQEDFDFTPRALGIITIAGGSEVIEHDLRYRFETKSTRGVLGLFFTQIDNRAPSLLDADAGFSLVGVPSNTRIVRESDFKTQISNFALYGEVEIDADRWLPGLSFLLGARYDWERLRFEQSDAIVGVPPRFDSGDNTYQAFLPNIGVLYDISEHQSIGLTYERGYRSGSVLANIPTGIPSTADPEFTDTVELVYRGRFWDDRVRLAANAYYTFWRDQQVVVPAPGATNRLDNIIVNAGKSELWGVELSFDAEVTDRLSLFGSYTYNETRFIEFVTGGENLVGRNFQDAPENTLALGGRFDLNDAWSVGLDVSFTGSAFSDVRNNPERVTDDRWLTNFQVNYQKDNFRAGLFVRNVFDVDYLITRIPNREVTVPRLTDVRGGDPRTVGIFIQQDF